MISIVLGLFAACVWALHDLVARVFTGRFGPLRMAMLVLLAGAVLTLPPVLWRGNLGELNQGNMLWVIAMGAAYAIGLGGLLLAFSKGPVSVVGPLTSAYPAVVVVWGLLQGLQPTPLAWAGLIAILLGGTMVGALGPSDGGFKAIAKSDHFAVIVGVTGATLGFAGSAILGQALALTLGAVETTFFSRFPAALFLLVPMLRERPIETRLSTRAIMAGSFMALCDVSAVTAINATGHYPNKAYGAVVVSAYGAIAALLGVLFLKEKANAGQWLGIGLIACGIAALAIP